jgi:hypothetical protein
VCLVKERQSSCPSQASNYDYLSCPPHCLVTIPTAQSRHLCAVEDNTHKKDLMDNTQGQEMSLF